MAHMSGKPGENVPVNLGADVSHLSPGDEAALPHLINAIKAINLIYLTQMRQYLELTNGIFDKSRKPDFYPAHVKKAEIEAFLDMHPDMREEILSPFTVVLRKYDGFRSLPYSEYYWRFAQVASCLDEAAAYVSHAPFADFLRLRAKAFRTNQFRESDVAWVKCVGGALELIIGPYEHYKDDLFGVKRDNEGYLGIVLPKETGEAKLFEQWIGKFDAHLGSLYGYRPMTSMTPLTFIDQIVAGGSPVYDYTTMACNLPNEADIHEEIGSKKTFFNNVMRAKFELLAQPIAKRVLGEVPGWFTYDIYRQFIIGHEASHGISFRFDGDVFGSVGSSIEEAKADIFGLRYLYFLEDKKVVSDGAGDAAMMIHAIDMLRQLRFGLDEAHAVGALIQIHYFLESGAYVFGEKGFDLRREHFRQALHNIGNALYDLSQTRDRQRAEEFRSEKAQIPDELRKMIARLDGLPVDIDPIYAV